jgi:hypothetical protein
MAYAAAVELVDVGHELIHALLLGLRSDYSANAPQNMSLEPGLSKLAAG